MKAFICAAAMMALLHPANATESAAQGQRCQQAQYRVNLDRQRLNSATDPTRQQAYAEQLKQAEQDAASICAGGGPVSSSINQQRHEYSQCRTVQSMYEDELRQAHNPDATAAQRANAQQQADKVRQRVAQCAPILKAPPN